MPFAQLSPSFGPTMANPNRFQTCLTAAFRQCRVRSKQPVPVPGFALSHSIAKVAAEEGFIAEDHAEEGGRVL